MTEVQTVTLTAEQAQAIDWRAPERPSSQVRGVAWVGLLRHEELAALLPEGFIDPNTSAHGLGRLGHEAGALLVSFHSGAVYAYENVSEAQTDELLAMASVGRALNQQIKPGRRYAKVTVEE
jgi:hypothetical protein